MATLPKVVFRPVGLWVITPFWASHSEGETPHCSAAAWTSIMRAAAPPLRTYCSEVRIPLLPPVENEPQTAFRLILSAGVGYE